MVKGNGVLMRTKEYPIIVYTSAAIDFWADTRYQNGTWRREREEMKTNHDLRYMHFAMVF